MKKELIVSEIEGPRHGCPYVYVVLTDARSSFIAHGSGSSRYSPRNR